MDRAPGLHGGGRCRPSSGADRQGTQHLQFLEMGKRATSPPPIK